MVPTSVKFDSPPLKKCPGTCDAAGSTASPALVVCFRRSTFPSQSSEIFQIWNLENVQKRFWKRTFYFCFRPSSFQTFGSPKYESSWFQRFGKMEEKMPHFNTPPYLCMRLLHLACYPRLSFSCMHCRGDLPPSTDAADRLAPTLRRHAVHQFPYNLYYTLNHGRSLQDKGTRLDWRKKGGTRNDQTLCPIP